MSHFSSCFRRDGQWCGSVRWSRKDSVTWLWTEGCWERGGEKYQRERGERQRETESQTSPEIWHDLRLCHPERFQCVHFDVYSSFIFGHCDSVDGADLWSVCVSGTAAMRNTKKGSWFIQELNEAIRKRANDTHMSDILVQVRWEWLIQSDFRWTCTHVTG